MPNPAACWAARLERPDVVYVLSLISHSAHRTQQRDWRISWRRNHELIGPAARRCIPAPVIETLAQSGRFWAISSRLLIAEAARRGWFLGRHRCRRVPPYVAADRALFLPYLAAALDARAQLDLRRSVPVLRITLNRTGPPFELHSIEDACWRHGVPAVVLEDLRLHRQHLTFPGRAGLQAALDLPIRRRDLRGKIQRSLRWAPASSPLEDALAKLLAGSREPQDALD